MADTRKFDDDDDDRDDIEVKEKKIVTAVFPDRESAERAYASAVGRGYGDQDISLIMSEETRDKHFQKGDERIELEHGNKAGKGAATGAGIGGTLGAAAGAIAAIGYSLVIPGLGLIVAGPLAAGLAGAGAGAATGGLIGGLVGAGVPEDKVKVYEERLKKGDILVGVHPRNTEDVDYLENEWRTYRGSEIHR